MGSVNPQSPTPLHPEPQHPKLLRAGVDIGGTKIAAGLLDGQRRLVAEARLATPPRGEIDAVLQVVLDLLDQLLSGAGLGPANLAAIGLGFPGDFDPLDEKVKTAANVPGFIGHHPAALLQRAIEERFGVSPPVSIDNDAAAAAVAEAICGAGRGFGRQLYLTVSTGLGGARYGGHDAAGSEIHSARNIEPGLYLYPDPSQADRRLIDLCSGVGLAAIAQHSLLRLLRQEGEAGLARLTRVLDLARAEGESVSEQISSLSAAHLGRAAIAGEVFARRLFERAAHHLAQGLAQLLAQGEGEECLVIGGSIALAVPGFLDHVRRDLAEIRDRDDASPALRAFDVGSRLRAAQLGQHSGVVGAALLTETGRVYRPLLPAEVLVIGASGCLGSVVLQQLSDRYYSLGTYRSRPGLGLARLDLHQAGAAVSCLERARPRIVVHCVAPLDVASYRRRPGRLEELLIEGNRQLAMACKRLDARLVWLVPAVGSDSPFADLLAAAEAALQVQRPLIVRWLPAVPPASVAAAVGKLLATDATGVWCCGPDAGLVQQGCS